MVKVSHISFKKPTVTVTGENVWQIASDIAKVLSGPVEFKVVWADGEEYEGSANIVGKNGYDFGSHIRTFAMTFTGKAKPPHLTEEQYRAGLKQADKAAVAKLTKLLKSYDLEGTPQVQDDPAPAAVVNLREWRFKNIPESVFPRPINPETFAPSIPDDGFFPEPAVDVDNYEAKVLPFSVPTFHIIAPKGRM